MEKKLPYDLIHGLAPTDSVPASVAQAQRPPTLQRCLKRLSDMVTHAEQEDGVAVWWPLAAHSSRDAPSSRRLLRLEHEEAVILNSRDKVSIFYMNNPPAHRATQPRWRGTHPVAFAIALCKCECLGSPGTYAS
jgi:hypothetical protein